MKWLLLSITHSSFMQLETDMLHMFSFQLILDDVAFVQGQQQVAPALPSAPRHSPQAEPTGKPKGPSPGLPPPSRLRPPSPGLNPPLPAAPQLELMPPSADLASPSLPRPPSLHGKPLRLSMIRRKAHALLLRQVGFFPRGPITLKAHADSESLASRLSLHLRMHLRPHLWISQTSLCQRVLLLSLGQTTHQRQVDPLTMPPPLLRAAALLAVQAAAPLALQAAALLRRLQLRTLPLTALQQMLT